MTDFLRQRFRFSDSRTASSPSSSEESRMIVIDEDVNVEDDEDEDRDKEGQCSESCEWCHRATASSTQFTMRTEGMRKKIFCSERCFSQFRRAAFKKSKVCDWCRKTADKFITAARENKGAKLQFCRYSTLSDGHAYVVVVIF